MKILFLLPLVFLVSCATARAPLPPVEIITRVVQPELYGPPAPYPVQLYGVEWHVITESNLEEKLVELRTKQGGNVVIFGVTPRDYENLAHNLQELRRYIRQQNEITVYYREATAPEGKDAWIEENSNRTQDLQNTAVQEAEPDRPNIFRRIWPF